MKAIDAARVVAVLIEAYPQAQMGPDTSRVYERLLADLDFASALAAVERIVKTSKWLPTVAEIRSVALDLKHGPKRGGVEAWGDVTDAIRRVGSYQPAPNFTDPLVTECVRAMGWRWLCLSENDAADRARFAEMYDGLAVRARVDSQAARGLPALALAPPRLGWSERVPRVALPALPTGSPLVIGKAPRELPPKRSREETLAALAEIDGGPTS